MNRSAITPYVAAAAQQRSLRDLLVVLFRRRWLVIGIAAPIIVFGIYGALTTIAKFTAGAEVMIEARAVEDPSFQQRPVEYDIVMSGAAQIAQSIPVATKAAAALWDSLPALKARSEVFADIETVDGLRDMILASVNCGQIGESNLLSINFEHVDAPFALMVVGALTDAFMQYTIEKGQNPQAIAYYDEQIAEAAGEIDQLLASRVAVFAKSGLNAFQVNNDSGIQQMRALESSYFKARSARIGAEDRYRGVVAAIADDIDYLPSLSTSGKNANLIDARANLDKASMDLAALRLTYQEDSQQVQRQLQYVGEARRIFLSIRADFVRDLQIDVEIARGEEMALSESLGQYRAGLEAYPSLQRELYTLDLQVEAKRELMKALQTKRGEVRLKVQGDQRISNITPLNAPSIRMGVAGGKKILYLLVATIFALILGVLAALLVDMQDHRIYDRRQAEVVLDLPVLGTISPERVGAGRE